MSEPLFFAYYTAGSPYEQESRTLRVSLQALNLEYEILEIPCRGDWQKNTQAKSDVVLDVLERYPGRRCVYIDVDAVVLTRPELFWTCDCDFAAVMFAETELLSGTVFFRSNARTIALVKEWQRLNALYPIDLPDGRAAWDQRTLQLAVKSMSDRGEVSFLRLPQSYTYIVELSQRKYPGEVPIILHTRGSLRYGEEMKRVR